MAVARMVSENENENENEEEQELGLGESPVSASIDEVSPRLEVEVEVEPDADEDLGIQSIVYPSHFFRSAGPKTGDVASLRSSKRSSHFRMTRSASFDSDVSSLRSKETEDLPDAAQFLVNARTNLLTGILRHDDGEPTSGGESQGVLNRRKWAIQTSPAYAETRRSWNSLGGPRDVNMWDSFSSGAAAFAQRIGRKLGSAASGRKALMGDIRRGPRRPDFSNGHSYHPHFFDEKPVSMLYRYRGGVLEGDWLMRKTLENATLWSAETSVRALSEFNDYSAYLSLYSQALRREKESEGRCIRWRSKPFEGNLPGVMNPFRTRGREWKEKVVLVEPWTGRRARTQMVRRGLAEARATESLPNALLFPGELAMETRTSSRRSIDSKSIVSTVSVETGRKSLASLTKDVSRKVLQSIDRKLEAFASGAANVGNIA
jgi:hypothetical protein